MKKEYFSVRKIAVCGILIALNIILARFLSIQAWFFRVGFTFVTYSVAGILYGPVEGALVGGLGDLLGAVMFPTTGAYFPGFTLTAVLEGLVFGIFLHKKVEAKRVVAAVGIEQFILSMLMNTFWISVMYGKGFIALLPSRALQAVGMFVVEIIVILALDKTVLPQLRKMQ